MTDWLSPAEWQAVRLTLDVAARSVLFGLPPAVAVAFLLARYRFPGHAVIDSIAHLPLVLPPVVVGWLLLLLFGTRGPIGSWLLAWFGIRLVFTTGAATLACGVMVFPLMLRPIRLSIEGIDRGLDDTARTLGAGPLDRLFTVVLPLAAPGILVGAITGFAAALGEFGAVITFAGSIPGVTQTLPLAIYSALQVPGGEAVAARLSLVAVALAVAGLIGAERLGRRMRAAIGR
ncbi:MAG: molybdate ABC transporter permease subunit [Acetobacteraceae bacterium]|nr:molybdate ABC transporter permease subunit [Acetobacteraceae bacterium]